MGRATSDRAPPSDDALVGREREAELLRASIEGGAHLVTVTGTFGVGKTALVRDVVRRPLVRDGEPLVPVVVDLSEASTGEAMLDAIAQSLGRAGRTGRGGVGKALASAGPTLLVLDPFDRLVEESVRLRAWLDDAPALSIVVVSRERLGALGEQLVEISPLSSEDGARLLTALGTRHRGQFTPTEAERAALARIAERLDGIPLAIELAAPRLSVMGPDALLYRLENRWEVLRRSGRGSERQGGLAPQVSDGSGRSPRTGGAGAGEPMSDRHATLEASLGWSLELLEPGTREVLAALTVFRGGMTIDAAEAVIPAPASTGVLDALQSLRARSLVAAIDDGASPDLRLTLLSSVRDLAQRDLAPDQRARLEERHASYYVELAEREARAAEERGSPQAQARLSRERENLLAVVRAILGRGAVSSAAADRALRALCAVGPSLIAEGASAELVRDLELGLSVARGSGADPRLIARALTLRAELAEARGERAAAERDLSEALVLSHHARDASLEARVLLAASRSAVHAGEPSRAAAAIGRAKELGRGSLEPHLATRALWLEGAVAEACRDPIGARLAYEESLARARALDLPFVELDATRALAFLDLREGALDALAGRVLAGRTLLARLPHARSHAAFLALAAVHAQLRGDLAGALRLHDEALRTAREAALETELPWHAGLGAIARAEAGERGEARAGLAEARSGAAALDPDFALLFAIARSRLARSAGRLTEADDESHAARAIAPRARDAALVSMIAADPPDTASGLVALASRVPLVGGSGPPSVPPDAGVLRLGPDASWFRPPGGERVDLSRRKPLRLLLARLATERDAASGGGLSWDALLEAGWPGEKMRADAGAHRVRVAISTLRKMGLSDALRTSETGYFLAPDIPLEWAR
ncbi:MAG: hypothetical protein U0234_25345 [Sandaracinus sp.]